MTCIDPSFSLEHRTGMKRKPESQVPRSLYYLILQKLIA